MTDTARMEEIKERLGKATPGPWAVESCGEKGDGANVIGVCFGPDDDDAKHPLEGWLEEWDEDGNEIEYYRDERVAVCEHTDRNCGHDATFIAYAPSDIAFLLSTISRLEGERDAARNHSDFLLMFIRNMTNNGGGTGKIEFDPTGFPPDLKAAYERVVSRALGDAG